MLKDRVLQITKEMVGIYSPTNTAEEQKVEAYLLQLLQGMSYFKEHPEHCGAFACADDCFNRSTIYGLVLGKSKKTVVFMGHHDVVSTEVYGALANFATDVDTLEAKLQSVDLPKEASADLASGEWLWGRGTCDMKGGTAAQLAVLEQCAQNPDAGSILFVSVPDEEAFSVGMRSCLPLLKALRERYGLEYEVAINCEPNIVEEGKQIIYSGSVGKMLPVVLVQGKSVQIGSYPQGVNPVAVLAEIICATEADYQISDKLGEESTVPPVWNFARDLKPGYDFSLPRRGAGYCNVLTFSKTPAQIMDWFVGKCNQGAQAAMAKQGCGHGLKVMTYGELLKLAQTKAGFEAFNKELQSQMANKLQVEQLDFPSITLWAMEQVLDFTELDEPVVITAFAQPYYPALNSSKLVGEGFKNVVDFVGTLLPVKCKEYFMGISDCSYLGMDAEFDSEALAANMPCWGKLYSYDMEALAKLQIPFLLLGPWGKDLHQRTERVHVESLSVVLPKVLQEVCAFVWK
jgi:arginine utilization protein RocB